MEVVEQLDFLVTNAEVQELLTAVDLEAQDASFKRPSIACETSKHVRVHSPAGRFVSFAFCPARSARACVPGLPGPPQVLAYLGSVPSCNTTSAEVATLMERLSAFAPLVRVELVCGARSTEPLGSRGRGAPPDSRGGRRSSRSALLLRPRVRAVSSLKSACRDQLRAPVGARASWQRRGCHARTLTRCCCP